MRRFKFVAIVILCIALMSGCGNSDNGSERGKTTEKETEVTSTGVEEDKTETEAITETEEKTEEEIKTEEKVETENNNTEEEIEPSGAPDVPRTAEYYGATDEIFLGDWVSDDDGVSTITISEDNPQTGGYYLEIVIYNAASATANANIDGEGLSINQGFWDNNSSFYGIVEKTDTGIRLTITESDLNLIKAGTVYNYSRKNDL